MIDPAIAKVLHQGIVIPAHPLALNKNRELDESSQRELTRYYLRSGAGGIAIGVHTTQFAIHSPDVGLYRAVLEIAKDELDLHGDETIVRVAGIIGRTDQAIAEASLSQKLGYHLGLLSLSAMTGASEDALIEHCRAVAEVIPLFGFYLQPDVGGLDLPYSFWRRFVEIENVAAIKIAAFDRYKTFDVIRAVAESGRTDIALYTGNDDNIVADLISTYRVGDVERRFAGGLLGHWAVWTRRAVELQAECKRAADDPTLLPELMVRNNEVTDCNAVIFDAANKYTGCIPGIMEVLRRQGLVESNLCLDENEVLSPGQTSEIDRIMHAYPHLVEAGN